MDTKFQYNFYVGEEIITDPYADVIWERALGLSD